MESKRPSLSLHEVLILDAARYASVPRPSIITTYIKNVYYRYIFWFRVCHFFKKNKWKKYTLCLLPALILRHKSYKLGVFFDSNIVIGPGLKIIHGGCLYVNAKSIGSNFTIYQGVTIGESHGDGIPVIMDNVSVYAGAKIIGNVLVRKGCKVAANAVVTKDTPENAVMMGVPAHHHVSINSSTTD